MSKISRIRQFPPVLVARAVGLGLRGRVHFSRNSIGEVRQGENEDFEVFRKVILEPLKDQPESPGAMLTVRFSFARFAAKTNRLLSLIPIPFIVAQQGFRSKTWMTGHETGVFQGFYEFDSIEDAERYWRSFAMKLMRRRAVPETLSHEIKAG